MTLCEEIAKAIETLSAKLAEAQITRGVDPKEIKRILESLMLVARGLKLLPFSVEFINFWCILY